jgi:hypothetical protein
VARPKSIVVFTVEATFKTDRLHDVFIPSDFVLFLREQTSTVMSLGPS